MSHDQWSNTQACGQKKSQVELPNSAQLNCKRDDSVSGVHTI